MGKEILLGMGIFLWEWDGVGVPLTSNSNPY